MKLLTIYKFLFATLLKVLVICIFLLAIFNDDNLAVGHINDKNAVDIINPNKSMLIKPFF